MSKEQWDRMNLDTWYNHQTGHYINIIRYPNSEGQHIFRAVGSQGALLEQDFKRFHDCIEAVVKFLGRKPNAENYYTTPFGIDRI